MVSRDMPKHAASASVQLIIGISSPPAVTDPTTGGVTSIGDAAGAAPIDGVVDARVAAVACGVLVVNVDKGTMTSTSESSGSGGMLTLSAGYRQLVFLPSK